MLKKEIFLETPQPNFAFQGMAVLFMSRDLDSRAARWFAATLRELWSEAVQLLLRNRGNTT